MLLLLADNCDFYPAYPGFDYFTGVHHGSAAEFLTPPPPPAPPVSSGPHHVGPPPPPQPQPPPPLGDHVPPRELVAVSLYIFFSVASQVLAIDAATANSSIDV